MKLLSWDMRWTRKRWMGWWYLAIAIGFAVLAIDHVLTGDTIIAIGLRLVIAAGFGLLSWMELNK